MSLEVWVGETSDDITNADGVEIARVITRDDELNTYGEISVTSPERFQDSSVTAAWLQLIKQMHLQWAEED